MIEAAPRVLARTGLLDGLKACDARVYHFIAGAGFGKSTLAWELGRDRAPLSLCDLLGVRSEIDAWRRLIDALAKLAGPDSDRIARESLTPALSGPGERAEYLYALAQRAPLQGTLLVENAEHLREGSWRAPLRAFLRGQPRCTVTICSRTDLDLHLAARYAPHEFVTVRERDLRFDLSDFRRLLDVSVHDERAQRAFHWSAGWPLAALRAIALLRRGDELPESPDSELWLKDVVAETIAALSSEFQEALFRLAAIPDACPDEIFAVSPAEQRKNQRAHLAMTVPFVAERPDGSFELHALAREALLAAFASQCRRARDAVAAEARERGDYLRCATLALQYNDAEAAAEALVRADHDFYEMPSSRYVAVLERLDRDIVLQRPALWMVSEISLKSDFLALNRELEPVFRAQAATLPPRTRMACAALVCFRKGEYDGRWEEGSELLDEFERAYAADCADPRDLVYPAMYRNGSAAHSGTHFDSAAFWRRYGGELTSAKIFYGESLYWDMIRAYHGGDAQATRFAVDRYIDHNRAGGYPVYRRASLYRSLFMYWEIGPRERYEDYRRELLALLNDVTTPNDLVSRLAWEFLDATAGVPPYDDGPIVSTGCFANLMLAAESDDYDVIATAMAQAVAMSGSAALRNVNVKLSVAAFAFEPAAYEHLLDNAFVTYGESAAPALREAVRRLRVGEGGGILEPLAARFRAAGDRFRNRFFVDVTLARIRRGGAELRLGERELELLMLLAAHGRAMPALELAELLWPGNDDASARNALKVCISRIRTRLNCKEIIETGGGEVRLSPSHVQTDLDRAERLLRLHDEGSEAGLHAARTILQRPVPARYAAWTTRDAITARWASLVRRL